VDADEFRFAVIDKGQVTMLANGKWWKVNNTFLHIERPNGYVVEYLCAVTPDGYFMHDLFMKYERADFRMFQKYENAGGKFPATCINDSCSTSRSSRTAPTPCWLSPRSSPSMVARPHTTPPSLPWSKNG
jgi:hypothetical protein